MTSGSPNGDRPQRRDTVAEVARNLDERLAVCRRRTTGTSMPRSHGPTSWRWDHTSCPSYEYHEHDPEPGSGMTGFAAIKYTAIVIIVLAILAFLAWYVVPAFD
jgi:hypothetical protein